MQLKYKHVLIVFISLTILSCKKAVEVDPPVTGLVSTTVYENDYTAAAAISGIYVNMSSPSTIGGGPTGLSASLGLSADELAPFPNSNAVYHQLYKNALTNTSSISFWNQLYNYIYQANVGIEKLNSSISVTPLVKQQLLGEAKFIRAFSHFYLVNIFGDVPLVTTSDYRINAVATRTPKALVYQQIIDDLKSAQNLLSEDFLTPTGKITTERVRPNKGAATALLARVYLYNYDWANAETQSTVLLNNIAKYSLKTDLNDVFLKNSTETIWQLQVVETNGRNTYDGQTFILPTSGPNTFSNPFTLTNTLVNSYDLIDQRKVKWMKSVTANSQTYYYPYKYKVIQGTPVTEYTTILRLAEQYLVRAEARAQLNKINEAQSDLNIIRNRAGLLNTLAATKADLLSAIEDERRKELFTEYGHRWLDLKREKGFTDPTKSRADEVMPPVTTSKGGTWNTNWQLYPIAVVELLANPNLTQNLGYQ